MKKIIISIIVLNSLFGFCQVKPKILGEGIISKGVMEFNGTLTKDDNTIFFTVGNPMWSTLAICYSNKINNDWGEPKLFPFSGQYLDADPILINDNRLYFISDRPINEKDGYNKWDYNIWFSDFIDNQWSEPIYLDGSFNELGMILYPSFSKNKNLYFTAKNTDKNGLFFSEYHNNEYLEPKKLSFVKDDINYLDAIVSKNETFIIFTANMEGGFGGNDLWISFKKENIWQTPINLGAEINSVGNDGQPGLSQDEKTLYYSYGGNTNSIQSYKSYNDLYNSLTSAKNGFLDIYYIKFNVNQFKVN